MIIAVNFQFTQLEGRGLKNIRTSTGFEIYCDDHSSLSSTTAAQYAFHIYFKSQNSHHFPNVYFQVMFSLPLLVKLPIILQRGPRAGLVIDYRVLKLV